jgi:hypothetical protein
VGEEEKLELEQEEEEEEGGALVENLEADSVTAILL